MYVYPQDSGMGHAAALPQPPTAPCRPARIPPVLRRPRPSPPPMCSVEFLVYCMKASCHRSSVPPSYYRPTTLASPPTSTLLPRPPVSLLPRAEQHRRLVLRLPRHARVQRRAREAQRSPDGVELVVRGHGLRGRGTGAWSPLRNYAMQLDGPAQDMLTGGGLRCWPRTRCREMGLAQGKPAGRTRSGRVCRAEGPSGRACAWRRGRLVRLRVRLPPCKAQRVGQACCRQL